MKTFKQITDLLHTIVKCQKLVTSWNPSKDFKSEERYFWKGTLTSRFIGNLTVNITVQNIFRKKLNIIIQLETNILNGNVSKIIRKYPRLILCLQLNSLCAVWSIKCLLKPLDTWIIPFENILPIYNRTLKNSF